MVLRVRSGWLTAAGAALIGLVLALCAARFAAPPSADVARGSEDAFFAAGLYERERGPDGRPLRWTRARATAAFKRLPAGRAWLAVEVHGHQSAVRVLVGGTIVGSIAPSMDVGEWPVTLRGGEVDVTLDVAPFHAGDGRLLGAQLRRITLAPVTGGRLPGVSLALLLVLPAVVTALLARLSGCRAWTSLGLTTGVTALAAGLIMHCGVLRSSYAEQVAGTLAGAAVLGALFAGLAARRVSGAGAFAFPAVLVVACVQLLLAPSPLMVASDAVMHAHKLESVAQGDLFPTSVTQHAHSFRIPYGVAFFALLAPVARLGLDAVTLVRVGAGVAGLFAALGVFLALARRSPGLAALATIGLQLLPGTFLAHSQGNLANVFGQALTTIFFAWWVGTAPGGWLLGALLFALAGLGHLSSAIVLAVLAVLMAGLGWEDLRADRWRRGAALAAGAVVVALYYASFWRLIAEQAPRLLEGAGQGRGPGLLGVLTAQLEGVGWVWLGAPAVALAFIGWRRLGRDRLRRGLDAFLVAGGLLLLVALATPLDVRYLYALGTPVAILAAAGADSLWAQGRAGRLTAVLLASVQIALAASAASERLFFHYR